MQTSGQLLLVINIARCENFCDYSSCVFTTRSADSRLTYLRCQWLPFNIDRVTPPFMPNGGFNFDIFDKGDKINFRKQNGSGIFGFEDIIDSRGNIIDWKFDFTTNISVRPRKRLTMNINVRKFVSSFLGIFINFSRVELIFPLSIFLCGFYTRN